MLTRDCPYLGRALAAPGSGQHSELLQSHIPLSFFATQPPLVSVCSDQNLAFPSWLIHQMHGSLPNHSHTPSISLRRVDGVGLHSWSLSLSSSSSLFPRYLHPYVNLLRPLYPPTKTTPTTTTGPTLRARREQSTLHCFVSGVTLSPRCPAIRKFLFPHSNGKAACIVNVLSPRIDNDTVGFGKEGFERRRPTLSK